MEILDTKKFSTPTFILFLDLQRRIKELALVFCNYFIFEKKSWKLVQKKNGNKHWSHVAHNKNTM
jgi:hypothetical protein